MDKFIDVVFLCGDIVDESFSPGFTDEEIDIVYNNNDINLICSMDDEAIKARHMSLHSAVVMRINKCHISYTPPEWNIDYGFDPGEQELMYDSIDIISNNPL